jgi:hypothetical protein
VGDLGLEMKSQHDAGIASKRLKKWKIGGGAVNAVAYYHDGMRDGDRFAGLVGRCDLLIQSSPTKASTASYHAAHPPTLAAFTTDKPCGQALCQSILTTAGTTCLLIKMPLSSKRPHQLSTNQLSSPAGLTRDFESESESESLSEFRALPLPMLSDAETDSESPMSLDAETDSEPDAAKDVVAERGRHTTDVAREVAETMDPACEIAAAVCFPASVSREEALRRQKREETERENWLLDEIEKMFEPIWKGQESEIDE